VSHVLLIGFMGSGKSTVGRLIADEMGMPFIDLDERIVSEAEHSIPEIFEAGGESAFRDLEAAALQRLTTDADSVVACGGGVVVRDENRALLKSLGCTVYLRVSAGESLARIGDTSTRPLLAGSGATLAATSLLAARESLYAAVADLVVQTEGRTPREVADEVEEGLRRC